MTRVNLLLLAVLIVCALSLVTSRNQARRAFVELERAQGEARAYETEFGQLQLEQSTWGMPGRVEKIAREQKTVDVEIVQLYICLSKGGKAPWQRRRKLRPRSRPRRRPRRARSKLLHCSAGRVDPLLTRSDARRLQVTLFVLGPGSKSRVAK